MANTSSLSPADRAKVISAYHKATASNAHVSWDGIKDAVVQILESAAEHALAMLIGTLTIAAFKALVGAA